MDGGQHPVVEYVCVRGGVAATPELLRDPRDHTRLVTPGFAADVQHHPDRSLTQLDRILLRPAPRTTGCHESILVSKVRRLGGSQADSFERFFSRLKNAERIDFASNLKVRGIIKVTLMTALAAVATNPQLRFNRDYENGWRNPDE